jgi:phenylpropionate dioxygenase-like ring-hydroxylating dioxygenase large terminal subunit
VVIGPGPTLRDGTRFGDLFDPEFREVSMRVLSDEEIYRLEMKYLFPKIWNLVGHVSEIPESGDYMMRHVGEDAVIITRDRNGDIHAMLNVCTHRGMQVCRAEGGKGTQFKCPYHGWIFSNTGKLLGAPIAPEKMEGTLRSREELGLRKARVETRAGLIFVNFDQEAESLDEFLGGYGWYLDLMFDRTESGIEVFGPPQRFLINANWKCPGEQHNVDGFHLISLHASLTELALLSKAGEEVTDEDAFAQNGANISCNGHALRLIDLTVPYLEPYRGVIKPGMDVMERLQAMPPAGMRPDQVPQLRDRFDDGQLKVLADMAPNAGGLFPNGGIFSVQSLDSSGQISGFLCLHLFVPKGPHHFEMFNWFLVEKDTTPEQREVFSRAANLQFGVSGVVEPDDADTWPQMTDSARGALGSESKLRYQAILGEHMPPNYEDFPGPGKVFYGFSKDDCQFEYWKQYFSRMTKEGVV